MILTKFFGGLNKQVYGALIAIVSLILFAGLFVSQVYAADTSDTEASSEHILSIHDDGASRGIISKQSTLRAALKEAGIRIDKHDRTEPKLDEKLVAKSYQVNIYRARPVIVRDGGTEVKVMTSYRTPKQIAKEAGVSLRDEDEVSLRPLIDPTAGGVAEVMEIKRAKQFTFDFYNKTSQSYTKAATVGQMLREKGITLGKNDGVEPGLDAYITSGMTVRLWREGVQTVTDEEAVDFPTRMIEDADRPIGFSQVEVPGKPGKKIVTYQIEILAGREVSRKLINEVVTEKPTEQVVRVGAKPGNGLTKAKGVNMFRDSSGVVHRETYYDLDMSRVMTQCGGGGYYTVRSDGVKVDKDGYVIIAAHLGNYPRCSVVETSVGLAKVYDTGGFVATYPHGYDIATDWSRADGI